MEVSRIHGLCYSATGVTEKVVRILMEALEGELGLSQAVFHSFRKPSANGLSPVTTSKILRAFSRTAIQCPP